MIRNQRGALANFLANFVFAIKDSQRVPFKLFGARFAKAVFVLFKIAYEIFNILLPAFAATD